MIGHLRATVPLAICTGALCLAAVGLPAQVPRSSPPGPSPVPAQIVASTEAERILSIRVVTEAGEVLKENLADLPLQPGQQFNSEVVRESLRQLYRTGRYADLRAETSRVAGGLRLDFVVQQNFFVNLVRVTGLREPPGEPLAIAAMRLGLGQTFRESTLREGLASLRQTLREEGLYQAQVEPELLPHPGTRQMDIVVRVVPGPRARLGVIQLHNHSEFPDQDLLGRSKLRAGHEVTSARLARAAERLRKFLVGKDHLSARVTIRRGEYDPKSNTLPLVVELTAGPGVRVEVVGAKISSKQLRKLLPIYQEGAVDEDLLQEGRRALRDYLEGEGYFDAQVRYMIAPREASRALTGVSPAGDSPEEKSADEVVTYQVDRGPRRRLVGVAFDDNKYFSDELLSSRLRVQPAAFAARGRFSRRLLEDDVTSIRDLYVANGFREAQVRSEVMEDYRGKEGDLFVRFHIVEGSQTRVAELKLAGNQALSDNELLAVIGSTSGQPYSEFNVSGDRDNILALYYNEGFPEARFTATVEELPEADQAPSSVSAGSPATPTSNTRRARLTYHIVEGPQVRVARVLLGGYEHTRLGVVQREVQVKAGGPLREGEVLETQRRLYNLGIFSRVSIAPQNPAGTDPAKTVVVLMEEAKRYTLGYGFGFEVQRLGGAGASPVSGELRASPRGILEITKANLTGRADTLSFKVRASTLQGRALLSYTELNFFSRPALSLQLTGFADKSRDIRTFTSTRYEGSVQLAQRLSLVTSLLYRYSFRRVTVGSLNVSQDQIPLFSQPTKISAVGMTWFRERRNNPADATRGDFNNADVSIAGTSIGSTASFARLFVQNSSYHPVGRRFVFARSVRFGIEEPFGKTVSTVILPLRGNVLPNVIPLPERFFGGGGTSLRGFGLNQAGPRDPTTGFPIGGLALLIFNQELRFPMRLPFVGTRLGGALFYDAGNVFSRVGHISLRASPSSVATATGDLNYFSHTIGFGFRYATPIGPVRVDLGYQLNPAQFQFCEVGSPASPQCPPGQQLSTTKLPRFQFFFNLGSIF